MQLAALSFELERDVKEPLFVQLCDQIRVRIGNGQIRHQSRLPASRNLAQELGVSRSTVVAAYEQLAAEGYIEGRRGSGFYVRALGDAGPLGAEKIPRPDSRSKTDRVQRPTYYHPGYPDVRLFPARQWARCLARSARESPSAMILSEHRFGDQKLREAIAAYLADWRGLEVSADQILITAGSGDALETCVRTLSTRGECIGLENPCYRPLKSIADSLGLSVDWLPVDDDGSRVPGDKPGMVVLTPSHQFPLGGAMAVKRRYDYLRWASKRSGWIIEDDYDSEFRYSGRPIPALASLDQSGRTLYIGTFSKAFSVSLRLGYLIMPPALIERFESTLGRFGVKAALPCQRALANFIDDGDFYRHIRRVRRIYSDRRRLLLEQMQQKLTPYLSYIDHQAGMQVTAKLAPGYDDREVEREATRQGIRVPSLSQYYGHPPVEHGVLLGFCPFTDEEIINNVDRLEKILRELRP